jgi:hypothetical protein
MKTPIALLFGTALVCFTSGCVTGRRAVDVQVPSIGSAATNPAKGSIAIGQIVDDRHFENKPSSPSTPSIDGDANALSATEKSTFIGRQRNTWGHAMGDVALPDGETVQDKVADLLRQGLKSRGFEIVDAAATANVVTADIRQFWSWTTPGMFALSFEARIECNVSIVHGGKQSTFLVKGYGLNHGQFAKNANWQEAYGLAIQDFLTNLDGKLSDAGL